MTRITEQPGDLRAGAHLDSSGGERALPHDVVEQAATAREDVLRGRQAAVDMRSELIDLISERSRRALQNPVHPVIDPACAVLAVADHDQSGQP
ncbi:hypothetical protein GCM10022247_04830 [Allokutzneria multivorans]|uniref:Uncharacterized protein n=1 Tax=Allokutzneria multivorans TaxID=1142134 RepID=A0ABP7QWZ1_9PSEU